MPKMMLLAVATSGVLVGAAVTYLTTARRLAGGAAESGTAVLGHARTAGTKVRDAMSAAICKISRPTEPANSAFQEYRADVLARLQEEQRLFQAYVTKLRQAKDKVEFDAFMAERSRQTAEAKPGTELTVPDPAPAATP
jgi:hypothetical protein